MCPTDDDGDDGYEIIRCSSAMKKNVLHHLNSGTKLQPSVNGTCTSNSTTVLYRSIRTSGFSDSAGKRPKSDLVNNPRCTVQVVLFPGLSSDHRPHYTSDSRVFSSSCVSVRIRFECGFSFVRSEFTAKKTTCFTHERRFNYKQNRINSCTLLRTNQTHPLTLRCPPIEALTLRT